MLAEDAGTSAAPNTSSAETVQAARRQLLADLLQRAAGTGWTGRGSAADRLRVVIAAENASRSMGGEAVIPYHYFRVLRARGIDTFLITHERCREELERLFPGETIRMSFVRDHWLQKLLYQIGKRLPHMVAQNTTGLLNHWITQAAQRPLLRQLATPSTVIHQPTPVAPRFPSLLHDCGAPVVMGPLNGGMEYPAAFRGQEGFVSGAVVTVGRSLSQLANRLLPGRLKATLTLTANERTRAALPGGIQGQVAPLPENGVDLSQWNLPVVPSATDEARFVFTGRLIDWKALDLVLEALALTPGTALDVIGDGPMRAQWEQFAQTSGVADRVCFHGWMPQAEIAAILGRARALVLPSLFECGGAVVLEAMAMRRAVIATRWGGPVDYLDPSCGILVAPDSREALVEGFAAAMLLLRDHPEQAAQLGEAGRRKIVAQYDWERKVDAMTALYRQALAGRGARPAAL